MSMNEDVTEKVVPVRHVGRWIGVALVAVVVAMIVHTLLSKASHGLALQLEHCRAVLHNVRDTPWFTDHAGTDGMRHGHWRGARCHHRRDATFAESSAVGNCVDVHVVLSRYASLGADTRLVLHGNLVPDAQYRGAVYPLGYRSLHHHVDPYRVRCSGDRTGAQ